MLRMSDSVGTHSIHGLTSGDLRRFYKGIKKVKPGRRAGGSQKTFFSELEGNILPVIHGDPNARHWRQEVRIGHRVQVVLPGQDRVMDDWACDSMKTIFGMNILLVRLFSLLAQKEEYSPAS